MRRRLYNKGHTGGYGRITDAQWAWVYSYYNRGYSLKECAAFVGRSRNAVLHQFEKRGYATRADLPPLEDYRSEYDALG